MMHQALSISEILALVFSFADRQSKASCARVCKAWSENALDALWSKMSSPNGLVQLLSLNIKSIELGTGATETHLEQNALHRYFQFSRRVRRLEVMSYDWAIYPASFPLPHSVMTVFLTANLTHLIWKKDSRHPTESLKWCSLFLNPRMKSLSIVTGCGRNEANPIAINVFFDTVLIRAPHLENLEFACYESREEVGHGLCKLLANLKMLKTVRVNDATQYSEVIEVLATLLNLEEVCVSPSHRGDSDTVLPMLGDGAFPSIKMFKLEVSLSTLTCFLKSPLPVAQLQTLLIETQKIESPAQIHAFFCTIASNCPNIRQLKFSSPDSAHDNDSPEPLPFSCLEPLLACRALTFLAIDTPSILEFNDTEAACAASSWPHMRTLSLALPHFLYTTRPFQTTFASLAAFAKQCRDLQHLEMNIHPSGIPPPGTYEAFSKLECLSLAVGAAEYCRRELASFIAEITPPACDIYARATVHIAQQHQRVKFEERIVRVSHNVDLLRLGRDIIEDGWHAPKGFWIDVEQAGGV